MKSLLPIFEWIGGDVGTVMTTNVDLPTADIMMAIERARTSDLDLSISLSSKSKGE